MKDAKRTTNMGILAFAPLVLFVLWCVYYLVILRDYFAENQLGAHLDIAGTTVNNFLPLAIMFGVSFLVATAAAIYFSLDAWHKPESPVGNKVIWVLFLVFFNLIAFPVYWYMHIYNEGMRALEVSPSLT